MLPSAAVVRSAIALAKWVPASVLRAAAAAAGSLGWLAAPARRRTLIENARHLAPDQPPAAQRAIARRTMRNLFAAASDLFLLPSLDRDEVASMVGGSGIEHLRAAHAEGKGVIIVTLHVGAYELGGAWLAALGFPVHAVVEDIDPETNAALASYRRATGMQVISRATSVRALYRLLARGEILLLVADRMVGEGGSGLVVPFGDAWRTVPTGPAALALATGAPVLVGYLVRGAADRPRYLVHFDPAVFAADSSPEALTRRLAERFDRIVRQFPDQWYVFQPDWISRDPGV